MQPRLKPLADQVVVIIGASSGIGRQTALRLAERGARLVIASRDAQALDALASELRGRGAPDVLTVPADASRPEAMSQVAAAAVDAYGRIDTWAHVAGVDMWAPFETTQPEEFRRIVEINLLGPAYGAMAALPMLRAAGGGALIIVSSVDADVPMPYQAAYVASKHGVKGFIRSLRMELQADAAPVALTEVQPAAIDTPLFRVAKSRLGVEPKPPAPVYDPDVVAELIVHAAEHPSRELFAGGGGLIMALSSRFAPRLTDSVLARIGESMQRSETAKPASDPGNLEGPVPTDRIRGGYGGRSFSVANRVQMLPGAVRLGAVAAAVGGFLLLSRPRSRRDGD
jgi:short-subunit dehydrogenase